MTPVSTQKPIDAVYGPSAELVQTVNAAVRRSRADGRLRQSTSSDVGLLRRTTVSLVESANIKKLRLGAIHPVAPLFVRLLRRVPFVSNYCRRRLFLRAKRLFAALFHMF